ncbi:anthranilate/para-aminobenzoate synthases component I [Pelotomaculum thermopropionicum SI]|uniref:Anthranilate synthase component 1 n=1 Tax=Pelotomaculum thermopropionicum (strain DSM 13744 / JCM 10971 / SI) TaxID=370438 RepID=A5D1S7_PELTS|nr:anthranilate/para-aminobenzoate synthases component I [Pelotomaculum thermopropionicum SI]
MNAPGRAEYLNLSKEFNLIPVSCQIDAGLETPTSIFRKVRPAGPAYLLESGEGGEKLGRYSFIGFDPFLVFASRGKDSQVINFGRQAKFRGPPLDSLERILSVFKVAANSGLPRFFGGAVGYVNYETVRFIEDIKVKLEHAPVLPECSFMIAGTVLIFDNVRRTLTVVVNSLPGEKPDLAYDDAERKIEETIKAVHSRACAEGGSDGGGLAGSPAEASISREDFIKKVVKAKQYIRAGDILQVVLSRKLRLPFRGEAFDAYCRLRELNPSPYLFYLDFGPAAVVGASPEMLVRVEDGLVETCPIAGTRPRGKDRAADESLAADLLGNAKEKAEHLMLVDLGRNDLGKVCETGTVKVARFMEVEKFSHVMHLVSRLTGRLAPGKNCFDALKACFPAGTVTGAPKVRAMQIISELEPEARGVYAGAAGYFGFSGNMDTAIAIRTAVIHGGYASVQAGAGIVSDSDPACEYEETVNKAMALLKALTGD